MGLWLKSDKLSLVMPSTAAQKIPVLLKGIIADTQSTVQHVVKLAMNEPKQLIPFAKQNWIVFAPMLMAMFSGAVFGGDFDKQWYSRQKRPSYLLNIIYLFYLCRVCPPNWVFPVVWPILYMQIGYAIQLLWHGSKHNIRSILPQTAAIAVNLLYNYSWSVIFFGRHEIKRALRIAAGIALSGYAAVWFFYQVNPKAAVYLMPYCVWVTFACFLNWRFLVLNGATGQPKVAPSKKNK